MRGIQSNYFKPARGMELVRMGKYAYHAEDSTAYKIIRDTFDEKLICKLSEIEMFPPQQQRTVQIVQKNSTFRELFTYGLVYEDENRFSIKNFNEIFPIDFDDRRKSAL